MSSPDAYDLLTDAESQFLRAKNLAELMCMAGESLSQPSKNAITAGADTLHDVLAEAIDLLCQAKRMINGRSA